MTTFLIKIVASSNLAQVLAVDNKALDANSAALLRNAAASKVNGSAAGKSARSLKTASTATAVLGKEQQNAVSKGRAFLRNLFHLDSVAGRVGYTIYGLSFRVGSWFVPAMIVMASSMLPVIAGLLALGSAALVAGVGLAGFMGLGALMLSHRASKGKNYSSSMRLPYSSSASTQETSPFSVLFEPIWKVLDSRKFKAVVDNAVIFVTATFDSLADALANFMSNVDPGVIGWIEKLFLDWLPQAGASLAQWGSRILSLIGGASLTRLNNFFKYLAQGIISVASWLQAGGWDQLDVLFAVLKGVVTSLMNLGKSVLPVLVQVLNSIYPYPLRPIILALQEFFETLTANPNTVPTLIVVAQALLTLILIFGTMAAVVAIITSPLAMTIILFGILTLLVMQLGEGIAVVCAVVESVIRVTLAFVLAQFTIWMEKAADLFGKGRYSDEQIAQLEGIEWTSLSEAAGRGELSPSWTQTAKNMHEINSDILGSGKTIYDAGSNALHVFFHPTDAVVVDATNTSVNNKVGWEDVNSGLRASRTVNL